MWHRDGHAAATGRSNHALGDWPTAAATVVADTAERLFLPRRCSVDGSCLMVHGKEFLPHRQRARLSRDDNSWQRTYLFGLMGI